MYRVVTCEDETPVDVAGTKTTAIDEGKADALCEYLNELMGYEYCKIIEEPIHD